MFLSKLTYDEKLSFLNLAHIMMNIDEEQTAEEEQVFQRYQSECGIAEFNINMDISSALNVFTSSSDKIKKIVFVELWGIVAADEKLEESELKLMNEIGAALSLSKETMNELKNWMLSLIDTIKVGCELIAK